MWADERGFEADPGTVTITDAKGKVMVQIDDPANAFRVYFCFNEACEFAFKPPAKLHYCSRCPKGLLRASYCSVKCQRVQWPTHKMYCHLKTREERIALDNALNMASSSSMNGSSGNSSSFSSSSFSSSSGAGR